MHYLSLCDGCCNTFATDMGICPKCETPEHFSSAAPIDHKAYCYDIEVYPNVFTCRIIHICTDTRWSFEISHRRNQLTEFVTFCNQLAAIGADMIGFNNIGYDYPIIHSILIDPIHSTPESIYSKSDSIIISNDRFGHLIRPSDYIINQIDLYKIHHYDSKSRSTSLKSLEFVMKMDNIEDLPYTPGTVLTDNQIDELHRYNDHDVVATCLFYVRSIDDIEFRRSMDKSYINYNNPKIGEQILIKELNCNKYNNGTPRNTLPLNDLIFPYVHFESPEFNRILDRVKQKH